MPEVAALLMVKWTAVVSIFFHTEEKKILRNLLLVLAIFLHWFSVLLSQNQDEHFCPLSKRRYIQLFPISFRKAVLPFGHKDWIFGSIGFLFCLLHMKTGHVIRTA
ncbi:hypothetical protein KP509_19G008400 [Ceratopteris richardii]|uniref:Uncharacterized protein n=1 Tax=Ceratopteris richardii TaxID=49495 RepID=A0A8T2SIJ0_CERRI|nr:hypothetical protein KP509_19G008400 [Ceratopteris richardii]